MNFSFKPICTMDTSKMLSFYDTIADLFTKETLYTKNLHYFLLIMLVLKKNIYHYLPRKNYYPVYGLNILTLKDKYMSTSINFRSYPPWKQLHFFPFLYICNLLAGFHFKVFQQTCSLYSWKFLLLSNTEMCKPCTYQPPN